MKRYIIIAALLLAVSGFVCAQNEVGGPNVAAIGTDSAQQHLKEISVDKFELEGNWRSTMSSDSGYTITRLFEGGPLGKEPVPEEADLNIPDKYVLGTRVDFLHRGHASFTLYPVRPIPIEGITKTISVWAVGRNFNHELVVLIQDFFGRTYELYMGKLNFQGWKKLTVAVPPQADDGRNGVVQRNYHYYNQMGIKIIGFRVDVDPMDAEGSYYIYLDDLRAVTDLFAEDARDEDDMSDAW
ncbi:flagellar filament protein FlaA [Spirochaetia bacterium]|nr:flagellar filament protein FlaA [Spirochaetia bacterium]